MRAITDEDKQWIKDNLFNGAQLASRDIVTVITIAMVTENSAIEVGAKLISAQKAFQGIFNSKAIFNEK